VGGVTFQFLLHEGLSFLYLCLQQFFLILRCEKSIVSLTPSFISCFHTNIKEWVHKKALSHKHQGLSPLGPSTLSLSLSLSSLSYSHLALSLNPCIFISTLGKI
jgi:hypothetical protein